MLENHSKNCPQPKSSRAVCATCQRPIKVCLCGLIAKIDNQIEVGILQHPSETKQVKGTARIAELSLQRSQLWVGERLADLPGLVEWLGSGDSVFLLYPLIEGQTRSERAQETGLESGLGTKLGIKLGTESNVDKKTDQESVAVWSAERILASCAQEPDKFTRLKVLILDGTWRKTFKMMQVNPELKGLKRIELVPETPSQYAIRKQKNADSLSTVEAIYTLLSQLEGDTLKFQPLLTAFEGMQRQQLAFRQNR